MPSHAGARRRTGPSIEGVARLAGVSAQTVSRVSTGAANVRPATREAVLAAMGQLGYSPNRAARALRNGAFRTLGLMSHRFERTGETLTTEAVLAAAEAEDYAVTIVNVHSPEAAGWESAAHRLSSQAIDGLVIIRAEQTSPEDLALPAGLAVAVSDSRLVGHYPAVGSDHVQGSADAVRHLLDLGHRVVHHLAGPEDSDPANVRAAAWRRTLEQAGVVAPPPWRGDWSSESGYVVGRRIAADPAVTAVFCANDEMAIGLLRALGEAGRSVPGDVSIVGFDDLTVSAYLHPPLTSVRQDFHRIGAELVRLVLEQIAGRPRTPERVVVPTELRVRGTTAPPSH